MRRWIGATVSVFMGPQISRTGRTWAFASTRRSDEGAARFGGTIQSSHVGPLIDCLRLYYILYPNFAWPDTFGTNLAVEIMAHVWPCLAVSLGSGKFGFVCRSIILYTTFLRAFRPIPSDPWSVPGPPSDYPSF